MKVRDVMRREPAVAVGARPHPVEGFAGPFCADVANALRANCQREQQAVPS